MYQERLISLVAKKIGGNLSAIEAIADVLDISYDAAHRRISMKSKFSIEEAMVLAKHYGISLDNMVQEGQNVLVKKTKEIKSFHDLALYLGNSLKSLVEHQSNQDTSLYYSAKDIPLFYTIGTNLLSKFKLYVWLNLLDFDDGDMPFAMFQLQAPTVENSQRLKDFYGSVKTSEIWNDTTINSTLQQVLYFFQSGLLTSEEAKLLCDSLKELISEIEGKCVSSNEQYQLYYHELLILNNNVLVLDAYQKSLFVPYTMLGYFITKDVDTCKNALDFFKHQLKNSKLLNTAGTRDKKMFFNKAYQRIDFYKNQIISLQGLG